MNQHSLYFCLIKLIPSGISTKNFSDHKEIGGFLQDKKGLKHCKNRNILIFIAFLPNSRNYLCSKLSRLSI